MFKAIKNLAPNLNDDGMEMVTDFEAAIWSAARKVFPGMVAHGCSFHWAQAFWRNIQRLGLAVPYKTNPDVRKYIKQLLALPYLPAHEIEGAFNVHTLSATDLLKPLTEYIKSTWIDGQWPPENWSVYKRSIRTNNDVEGWHHRLNRHAVRSNLPMYMLVTLLYKEAYQIPYQMRMVSENQLRRYQRRATKQTEGNLAQLWKDFERNQLSISQLLKKASRQSVPPCFPPRATQ